MATCKSFLRSVGTALLCIMLVPCASYFFPHGGEAEQQWLDAAIDHLKVMREHCDDPDLQSVLDYTIQRYNKIGPFDVSVQWTVNFLPNSRVVGYNVPWLPGLTLDHDLLRHYPVEVGAVVLVHEALHDYWPYLGHSHITHREEKLFELSGRVQ